MILQTDWIAPAVHVVLGIVIMVSLWLIQTVINKIIKKKLIEDLRMPKNATNGIVYAIRIVFACIILFVFLSYFGLIDTGAALNMTAVLSTAIGFSCTIAMSNFVAGLYLIASRPYSVGDFVRIGTLEGFVKEIGLNYTTIKESLTGVIIRVPNRVAMNENLWIYKVPKKKEKKGKRDIHLVDAKVVRYTFFIESDLSIPAETTLKKLKEVCQQWMPRFGGYFPKVRVQNTSFRARLRIVITADNMKIIQDQLSEFIDGIWLALHGQEKKEG